MYIAHMMQVAEGCEDSIACGESLIELKSTSYNDAIKELKKIIIGSWDADEEDFEDGYNEDQELDEVVLFKVEQAEKIPIQSWYKEVKEFEKLKQEEKQEKKDREQYEKLKAKFK